MSKKTFTFKMTMGFWEGELIVKALEAYKPEKKREECSKEDLIKHLNYQMTEAKESSGVQNDLRKCKRTS